MATEASQIAPTVAIDGDDWAGDFFRSADSFDIEQLVGWFSDDIEVRFGNQPAITGRAAAREAFAGFWSSIGGMRHSREALVSLGDMAAQMSIVTYTRHDGSEVAMPVASHLRRAAPGKIDRLWIFIDMAPLFQASV
jgi:ketosteroid isomerase-like protein